MRIVWCWRHKRPALWTGTDFRCAGGHTVVSRETVPLRKVA